MFYCILASSCKSRLLFSVYICEIFILSSSFKKQTYLLFFFSLEKYTFFFLNFISIFSFFIFSSWVTSSDPCRSKMYYFHHVSSSSSLLTLKNTHYHFHYHSHYHWKMLHQFFLGWLFRYVHPISDKGSLKC